jgi:copper homeostasis protein
VRALEDVIALRAERVLTSGGARSALEGAERIRERIMQSHGRLVVMPGAGITLGNIARVAALTGADELHASAKRLHPSGMVHQPGDTLGMAGGEIRTDEDEVRALMRAWVAA